jgi:hypothetical protein
MIFMLRLYLHKVISLKLWLLPAFLPPLIYLAVMSSEPDMFTVYRDISIPENAAYAVTTSPVDYVPLSDVIEHPGNFLLERFIIKELHTRLYPDAAFDEQAEPLRSTAHFVQKNVMLRERPGGSLRIWYHGADLEKGKTVVGYFGEKLAKKIQAGMRRKRTEQGVAASGGVQSNENNEVTFDSKTVVEEHTALFRSSRIVPAAVLFGITLAIILLWIAILESTDTSLKSERQASRYLELPAIGSLPDLNKIPQRIQSP